MSAKHDTTEIWRMVGKLAALQFDPPLACECPPDMRAGVAAVLRGEYDLPIAFRTPPVVLDIGANCGAFAVWASRRWPECRIHCYEPIPSNLAFLRRNVRARKLNAIIHPFAVTSMARRRMFLGRDNAGCASFFDLGEQDLTKSVPVRCFHPSKLPKADLVKVDAEGCEAEILYYYRHRPLAIVFEWHRPTHRRLIDTLLVSRGYRLVSLHSPHLASRGVAKYLRA